MNPKEAPPVFLTSENYWSETWHARQNRPIDPTHHYDRDLITCFDLARSTLGDGAARVLEIGCGDSVWLPFLAQRYGWSVSGIDFSPVGCALARKHLAEAGVAGEILERELFSPNQDLFDQFQVVYSGGFVEHFSDPVAVIRLMSEFLSPGGLIFTTVPNLRGLASNVHRLVGPENYALHKVILLEELCRFHELCGIRRVKAGYAGFGGMSVTDWETEPQGEAQAAGQTRGCLKALFPPVFRLASTAVRLLRSASERLRLPLPRSARFSPALFYLGRKESRGVD